MMSGIFNHQLQDGRQPRFDTLHQRESAHAWELVALRNQLEEQLVARLHGLGHAGRHCPLPPFYQPVDISPHRTRGTGLRNVLGKTAADVVGSANGDEPVPIR